MTPARLEKLIWVLIYGGLFALSLGYFMQPRSSWLGWLFIVGGGIASAAGFFLIWVLSRMKQR